MNKLDTRVQIAVIILGNTLNSKYINNQNICISIDTHLFTYINLLMFTFILNKDIFVVYQSY